MVITVGKMDVVSIRSGMATERFSEWGLGWPIVSESLHWFWDSKVVDRLNWDRNRWKRRFHAWHGGLWSWQLWCRPVLLDEQIDWTGCSSEELRYHQVIWRLVSLMAQCHWGGFEILRELHLFKQTGIEKTLAFSGWMIMMIAVHCSLQWEIQKLGMAINPLLSGKLTKLWEIIYSYREINYFNGHVQ